MTQTLTAAELSTLVTLLLEEAQRMDDDGREGAFNASPLRPVYDKLKRMQHAAR